MLFLDWVLLKALLDWVLLKATFRLGSSKGDFYILTCEAFSFSIYIYIYLVIFKYKLVKSETKFDSKHYGSK